MRSLPAIGCLCLLAACGSSAFSIASPSVDASYTCPAGASNAPYQLHATSDADNPTSQSVDVHSVSAVMVLAAVHGEWQQKVGSEYDAGQVQFSPKTIGANSKTKLQVTIPSACTNGSHPLAGADYGDYTVKLTVATSAGTFKLTSTNKHRIQAA
ncbi:MAG TPA: hypothetical protein VFO75_02700 [Candidatus Dormibacteraeota bacterium]|nr:hypothetical protein [Candidatus Dormibacteraeota bacterium]